jgi:hypothetical protein
LPSSAPSPFRLGDAPRGTGRRKQWAAALGVSFLAHLLVFLILIAGIPAPRPLPVDQSVEVQLLNTARPPPPRPVEPKPEIVKPVVKEVKKAEPPRPAPAPPKSAPKPLPAQAAPVAAPQARPVQNAPPQAQAPPAAAAAGTGRAPVAPAGQVAGRGLSPEDEQGRTNCLAKNMEKMDQKDRLACETHVFVFLDKQHDEPTSPPIDPAKRAEYDAALARKHYKSAPVASMGNKSQSGCVGANMGMGCPGEQTPFTGNSLEESNRSAVHDLGH